MRDLSFIYSAASEGKFVIIVSQTQLHIICKNRDMGRHYINTVVIHLFQQRFYDYSLFYFCNKFNNRSCYAQITLQFKLLF